MHVPNFAELDFAAEPVERAERQRGENADTLEEHPVSILEGERDFAGCALGLGRIGHAPMRGHRLAWPNGTCFARRVVADGENEIERRCAGLGELAPRLRAKAGRVIAEALQELDSVPDALGPWAGSRHCRRGISRALPVQDRLRND